MKKYILFRNVSRVIPAVMTLFIINYSFSTQATELSEPAPGKQVAVTAGIIGDIIDGYWLYLPKTHDLSKKWPIILFLQGGAGIGGELTTSKENGPTRYAIQSNSDNDLNKYTQTTFIIINPHMRDGDYWERQWYQQYNSLNSILDYVIKRYSGDPQRIYVTGLSRGGSGTWGLAETLNNRVAAIIPVCGIIHGVTDFSRIKNLPIWIIHSSGDPAHDYSESLAAVLKIEEAGGTPFLRLSTVCADNEKYMKHMHIFTTIESNAHNVWDITYSCPKIYRWMLQFKKK